MKIFKTRHSRHSTANTLTISQLEAGRGYEETISGNIDNIFLQKKL